MSDRLLLHMRLNLRWVRHNSAARFVSTLLQTGSTRINGTKGINSQVPFGITCTRVARHCYPLGDLLLPFGQFTLCPRRAGELGSLRKRPHDTAAQSRFYKLSIEYIHVKRNRQNCTKCPLNKNEPARRFAALILGCVEGRGFH